LSRWVTPPILPRRFDARFFAAELPAGARVSFEGDEVAGHAWMTPAAALAAMADDALAMWIPTSGTLQQLEHAGSVAEIRERLTPGRFVEPVATVLSPDVTRIVMPAGGGVAGQPIASYLIGHRRFVLVDPGDPTGPGLELAMAIAAERGGAIEAVALTQVAPDHAAGAEGLAEMLAIPILGGPGAGRPLPFEVQEVIDLDDLAGMAYGDVPMQAIHAPGPAAEHLAFAVGDAAVITGDLDGGTGARSIPGPIDAVALAASRVRVTALRPEARWLGAHPTDGAA
jgi:glyoxylase-like metal-dependent hydrolase (beta-lactamase superfamily II)